MKDERATTEVTVDGRLLAVGAGSLVVAFWGSVAGATIDTAFEPLRAVFGLAMVLFAPGILCYALLESDPRIRSIGEHALYGVGLSILVVAVVSVLVSISYPLVGISRPLSFVPIALTTSVLIVALAGLASHRDVRITAELPSVGPTDWPILALLGTLPVLAILAAQRLDATQETTLMYVVLLVTAGVVLASATTALSRWYPVAITSIAATVFLHRNMITDDVIGADIQANYYVAQLLVETAIWDPALAGSYGPLPVVTTVPGIVSIVTGISVSYVFKLVYSSVFALTPLGMYYVFKRPFGPRTAFVGGLFFVFFYQTFYETPGKQRIAQLFIVLLLLALLTHRDQLRRSRWIALGFGGGIVLSHYATTYIFLGALAAALILSWLHRTYVDEATPRYFSAKQVVGLGAFTVGWYLLTTPTIVLTFLDVVAALPLEVQTVLSGESVHRTGQSTIEVESGPVYMSSFALHMLLVALVGIGIAAQVLRRTTPLGSDEPGSRTAVPLIAIAIPLFGFLGASYFVAGNLGVDRMYQISLIVLGPFMPLGYLEFERLVRAIGVPSRPAWQPLLIVVVALLLFNSGIAYNVANEEVTSDVALDPETHTHAYTEHERSGGAWIANQDEAATVYTDHYTTQMFRAVLPEEHTEANVTQHTYDWVPYLEFSEGYIFVRERSVVEDDAVDEPVPEYYVTESDRASISQSANKVYVNSEAEIFRYDGPGEQRHDREG